MVYNRIRWTVSSVGRAPVLHTGCQGFESLTVHTCQGSLGGHGACLKNMIYQFDSDPWHINHVKAYDTRKERSDVPFFVPHYSTNIS